MRWRVRLSACFNTQPPEGGCPKVFMMPSSIGCFNTQPPEGGCLQSKNIDFIVEVSTHSRLKAAVIEFYDRLGVFDVSTHSRLKAAD